MPNSNDYNHFAVNPVNIDINRSMFNMDHSVKWSCNVGECIPFDCIEILPGDTVQIDTSKVVRLQPLVAPIMDEILLDTYYFFCPSRLVWSHWKEFMGENNSSAWAPEVEYAIPKLEPPFNSTENLTEGWQVGTIADYMGIPVGIVDDNSVNGRRFVRRVNALPFRSYALICDQWFRSESVMDPVHVHVDDTTRTGVNTGDQVTDIELGGKPFIACKFFDRYTSALPAPQRGDPVSVSFVGEGNQLPLKWRSQDIPQLGSTYTGEVPHIRYVNDNGKIAYTTNPVNLLNGSDSAIHVGASVADVTNNKVILTNGYVNLDDSALRVTINDLRTAFAVQRYLEKQARFGGRYIEFIKGFFGIDSPDARLQRTEYLGGSRLSLNISQVEQTSATQSNSTPLGNVAGMSVTADRHSDVDKSFTEHGFLIGIAVARYHHSYQDSLHPMWSRFDKFKYYNPVFANLGEMPVYKYELWGYEFSNDVFGYQEAWSDYRTLPNRIAGELRSVYQTPLDMWHLGDHYSSAPSLSPEWLREDKSNLDRCLAVTSDVSNQLICDFYVDMKMTRVMPMYSIPGLIDHH